MENENIINNNIQGNSNNQTIINDGQNKINNEPQPTVNNVNGNPSNKKSGKIVFDKDPVSFKLTSDDENEMNNTQTNNIPINNKEEENKELPTEQSGNITF